MFRFHSMSVRTTFCAVYVFFCQYYVNARPKRHAFYSTGVTGPDAATAFDAWRDVGLHCLRLHCLQNITAKSF